MVGGCRLADKPAFARAADPARMAVEQEPRRYGRRLDATDRDMQAFPFAAAGRALLAPIARAGADLQPRHLRPRASAALAGDRQRARQRAPRRLGPDHLGLAGDRQLRVRQRRRLRAHSRASPSCRTATTAASTSTSRSTRRSACARPSSCRPPRPSGPTSSSSTRSRPAFAARSCRRSNACSSTAAGSCSASATSWTSRRCSPPNGSAKARSRRCGATTTRSGSTG